MVTGGPAETVGRRLPCEHRTGRRERHVDRGSGGIEGSFGQRRRGLETPLTELEVDPAPTRERPDSFDEPRHGEHVRHDVVRAGMTKLVVRPGPFEEFDQAGIMDRADHLGVPRVGLDDGEAVVSRQRRPDRIGPTGMLERGLQT